LETHPVVIVIPADGDKNVVGITKTLLIFGTVLLGSIVKLKPRIAVNTLGS
jgi:hypothetical protein